MFFHYLWVYLNSYDEMKKWILFVSVCLLMQACASSRQYSAAVSGIGAGSILGSSIGGLAGRGPRGRDLGRLVGGVAGGMVGAAVTAPRGQQKETMTESPQKPARSRKRQRQDSESRDNVYDVPSQASSRRRNGNRTVEGAQAQSVAVMSDADAVLALPVQLSGLHYISEDGVYLKRGGRGEIVFELKNTSSGVQHNIGVYLAETGGNKAVVVSPPAPISRILPGQSLRYTAYVKGGKKLRDGAVHLSIALSGDGFPLTTVRVFTLETRK